MSLYDFVTDSAPECWEYRPRPVSSLNCTISSDHQAGMNAARGIMHKTCFSLDGGEYTSWPLTTSSFWGPCIESLDWQNQIKGTRESICFTSETRCHQTKAGDASECLARKKESVSGSRFFYDLHCLLHCTRKPERWILFQKEWIKIFFFYGGKYSYRPRTRPVKVCSCAES